ncbi:sensor histidine kinase [Flavobacterium reichenbachii]|uniref:Histidine kinase n=1 Tax=Flavobacterium reichenbachii TaxID=362418 RepID=A0A085ZP79_9FLAO|nr:sensor histidine kinase [Flavobacterium reichenbachii]KFF06243.1 histidine kinase [Flavobacterium reichenbachii]OXB17541.1 histidine kinase [Flavobacterium reichenbachii]
MKLKIPFYYHILLFLGLFITFYLWDIGVSNRKLESVFSIMYFFFNSGFLLSIFIVYLLNFYTFCDWFLNKKRMLWYFLSIPVSLLIFAGVRYFLQEVVVFEITGIHNYGEETRKLGYYIRDNFFFGLPSVILSALNYLFWQFQDANKQNQELLLENKKAQLQMLKSQVSPHFLFNTLNSFYSQLILRDDKMASDILVLSDLLRYVITETEKDEVLLSNEIQFVQNYIHLQQKRFEDQLCLDFEIEGNYANEKILSSALIHFIENVFKHAKLNNPDEKAIISIKIKGNFLELLTFNYNVGGENYSSTGIGFENLTKRLEYTYKDQFVLEKIAENNTFKTYLKIPLKK